MYKLSALSSGIGVNSKNLVISALSKRLQPVVGPLTVTFNDVLSPLLCLWYVTIHSSAGGLPTR